jgi:hypothetical protein
MADVVEYIDGSIIQHGTFNNRIYLMHLNTADIESLIVTLEKLARENGYGKILAKIPATVWPFFKTARFLQNDFSILSVPNSPAGLFKANDR